MVSVRDWSRELGGIADALAYDFAQAQRKGFQHKDIPEGAHGSFWEPDVGDWKCADWWIKEIAEAVERKLTSTSQPS